MLVKSGAGDTDPGTGNLKTEDGGLRYEVVLEEARTKKMPRPKSAPSISRNNQQDIQTKLKVHMASADADSVNIISRLPRSVGGSLSRSRRSPWRRGRGERRRCGPRR